MEPDCAFTKRELTDSSSEDSLSASTPNKISAEIFDDRFNYVSPKDLTIGFHGIHGLPLESQIGYYPWDGLSDLVEPDHRGANSFPTFNQLESGLEHFRAEHGLDQVPNGSLVRLFEGVEDRSHDPSTPIPTLKLETVAGLHSHHSPHTPSSPGQSTEQHQLRYVPYPGAKPILSIARQTDYAPPESEDSDDETMGESDFEDVVIPKRKSKRVLTLRECYCPFNKSTPWASLYDSDGVAVPAKVFARFKSKCLKKVDTEASEPYYITYRRNYFANEMWFELEPPTGSADGKLYVDYEDARYPVQSFAVRMRAVSSNEEGEDVEISVFTPKRDRPITPTPILEQQLQPNMPTFRQVYDASTGYGSCKSALPIYYSSVHNQFRQATKNNGNRRKQQSYYRIVVELRVLMLAPSGDEVWIKVASTISGSLVVRGRCPGSFADDPNFREGKSRKVPHKRRDHKAARPTKKKGQSKPSLEKIPKRESSECPPCHNVNSSVPSTMASLTSDSRSCPSTNATPFSAHTPKMSPRDEMCKGFRLPEQDGRPLLPVLHDSASFFLGHSPQYQALDYGNLAFENETFNSAVWSRPDLHKVNVPQQLDPYSFHLMQRNYADGPWSALPDHDGSSRALDNTPVSYVR